jgi:hypothetical protein
MSARLKQPPSAHTAPERRRAAPTQRARIPSKDVVADRLNELRVADMPWLSPQGRELLSNAPLEASGAPVYRQLPKRRVSFSK